MIALIIGLLLYALGAVIFYGIIRRAVHDGTREALRDHELWKREQDWSGLGPP